MSRESEEFVDVEGDGELSGVSAAQQAEAENSLAQDLQLTPENSDDEDRPGGWAQGTRDTMVAVVIKKSLNFN